MLLTVYADISCPFAHVGLRTLVQRRGASTELVIEHRAWPLELVNGAPLDPTTTAAKVAVLRREVAPTQFAGFNLDRFPTTTLPALALVAAGNRVDHETGLQVSLALRSALFDQGMDVQDRAVLQTVAERHGIGPITSEDQQQVLSDWHEGQARGVLGSPHFFLGEESWFCPSLSIAHVGGQLQVSFDESSFREFTDRVFTST